MLVRLFREPLFVFTVAGLVLFGLYDALQARKQEPVRLTAATRATLIDNFEALAGRAATPDDIARLERDFIADELLFREAIDSGLHLADSVVRGKLIEEMRLRVTGPLPDPTPEQLVNHYAEHLERYRTEPSVSFEHVYFRERPADELALLEQLQIGESLAGQPFEHGREFDRYGESMLRGIFGQPFVAAVRVAALDEWTGPIASLQGWHYVRVMARLPSALLPFESVRDQVENDYLVAVIQAAVDSRVAELEQRYDVVVER